MMMQIGSEQTNWQAQRTNNMVNSTESCASEYRGLSSSAPNGYYGSGHGRSQRGPYNSSSYVGLNGGYNDSNNSLHYSHFYGPNEPVSTSASPEEIPNSHSPISYTSNAWNGNDHRQSMAYATTPRHYPHAFNNSAAFLPSTGSTPHTHPAHHQQQYFTSGGCSAGYMNSPFPLDMSGKFQLSFASIHPPPPQQPHVHTRFLYSPKTLLLTVNCFAFYLLTNSHKLTLRGYQGSSKYFSCSNNKNIV